MQRQEKQLESLIDAVLNRLNDLKHSIGAMIHKIETEYETINWPTFLDNFALISSHVSLFHFKILICPSDKLYVVSVDWFIENFSP